MSFCDFRIPVTCALFNPHVPHTPVIPDAELELPSLLSRSITDEELYPWHAPPETSDGRDFRAGPDAACFRAMYALCRGPLIPALLRQRRAFPGGSHLALRLLAFALSWLRVNFCADRCGDAPVAC